MEAAAYLHRENARYGLTLARIPDADWPFLPALPNPPREVWRSRDFLVQIFIEDGHLRLSVCRTSFNGSGDRWADGISWDDLQRLKGECGRGDRWAVELFPPDAEVVNVANLRHVWLVAEPPYGWKGGKS